MSNLLQHKYISQTHFIEGHSPEASSGCCIKYLQNVFIINSFRILEILFFFFFWLVYRIRNINLAKIKAVAENVMPKMANDNQFFHVTPCISTFYLQHLVSLYFSLGSW